MDNSGNSRVSGNNKRFHILFLVLLLIFAGIRIHYHQYYTGRLTNDEGLYLTLGKDISEDFKIGPQKILLWDEVDRSGDLTKGFYRMKTLGYRYSYVDQCGSITDSANRTWLYNNKHWYYGRPPVIPYILGVSFRLFGVSEIVADSIFLFIIISSMIIVYLLASFIYNPKIGILALFFFGLSPINVLWGTTNIRLLDIPLMFGVTLAMFLIYLAVKRNSIQLYIFSGFMVGISFLIKYPGAVAYPTLMGYILISRMISNKQKTIAIVIVLFSSLIPLTPWFLYNLHTYGHPLGSFLAEIEFDKLNTVIGSIYTDTTSCLDYYMMVMFEFSTLLVLLAFLGFFISITKRSESDILIVSSVVILSVIFHVFGLYTRPRYLLPILPFLSILCAIGFSYILNSIKSIYPPTIYDFILIAIVVTIPLIYLVDASMIIMKVTMVKPSLYTCMNTVISEVTPTDAVVASPKFTQINFYSDRLTTPPYTNEESINHFNISFFAISADTSRYSTTLKYLMYNPRFEVINKIEYMNQTGYIFRVIDVEDGIYLDKANRIMTNYTNKQFSVYKQEDDSPEFKQGDNSPELIYSGFDGAVNSIDHTSVPNLIVRVDDVTPLTDVITLREIACVCDRYGCDEMIWAVNPFPDDSNIRENNELISFLKDREKNGDYVFIYGGNHNYGKLDIETQVALINRSKNQLESLGLHPVGFVPPKNRFSNDTLRAVSMVDLKDFSAGDGNYSYPGLNCYSHVQGYYSDILVEWLNQNISTVVSVHPKGDGRYRLRDIITRVKSDLYPLPTIIYDEARDFISET